MTPRQRLWLFGVAITGFAAFFLWGLAGLPGFGHYPGPYGDVINRVAVGQTNATGVVSAVNFAYRGFDTLGEEFILFVAATGVSLVLRHLRGERERPAMDDAVDQDDAVRTDAITIATLIFVGPTVVLGWFLASHAQTSPSGGFQGGAVLGSALMLIYLGGQFLTFTRISPVAVTDAVEAAAAGSFAAVGVAALALGLPYLANFLPLGGTPGAVTSSGTIALISFFVGIEVAAALAVVVSEMLEQTLLVPSRGR